jgi:hypothetical protein
VAVVDDGMTSRIRLTWRGSHVEWSIFGAGILFATASNQHLRALADGESPGSQSGAFR